MVASTPSPARHEFVSLDGMRGIAALFVVLGHLGAFYLGAQRVPESSYLAVDMFFILSGFVIAHAYERRLAAGWSWGRFMRARIIRFYPLYFAGVSLGLFWYLGQGLVDGFDRTPAQIILSLSQFFFVPDITSPRQLFPINGPAWSLLAELLINGVYALIWRRLGARTLTAIILLSGASLVAIALSYGSLNMGFAWSGLYGLAARVTFGFFAGVGIHRLFMRGVRAPTISPFPIYAVLALMLTPNLHGAVRIVFDLAAVLVAAPLMIWLGASSASGALGQKLGELSGRISYPIYILHHPMILLIGAMESRVLHGALQAIAPVSGIVMAAAFGVTAYLAEKLYDVPIRARLMNRSAKTHAL